MGVVENDRSESHDAEQCKEAHEDGEARQEVLSLRNLLEQEEELESEIEMLRDTLNVAAATIESIGQKNQALSEDLVGIEQQIQMATDRQPKPFLRLALHKAPDDLPAEVKCIAPGENKHSLLNIATPARSGRTARFGGS